MSLSEIITDSIKYPFNDLTKFFIVGIIVLLAGIINVFTEFKVDNVILIVIAGVVSLVFALILSGYSLSVISNGIRRSDEVPEVDFVKNFIDGIKVLLIQIIYFIIPALATVIIAALTGAIGQGLNHFAEGFGIGMIISVIFIIFFAIFEFIAIARFAKTEQFDDAFNFSEIFEDMKRIGIAKIIAMVIIAFIIIAIAVAIVSLIALVPYIGIIISEIIIGAFIALFSNRVIGLLYSEIIR